MRTVLKFTDIERGLNPEAKILATALWSTDQMNDDIAYALAQHAASAPAGSLNPEQLLLCVLSDILARRMKKNRKDCAEFLGFFSKG